MDELEVVLAHVSITWDCPECGTTNEMYSELEYGDEECAYCGAIYLVRMNHA